MSGINIALSPLMAEAAKAANARHRTDRSTPPPASPSPDVEPAGSYG